MRYFLTGLCLMVSGCAHAGEREGAGSPAAQPAPVEAAADCSYDFGAVMGLDFEAFDQDLDGGWRILGNTPGCEAETANLIHKYRTLKIEGQRQGLMHHEMQLRGAAAQYEEAAALASDVLAFATSPEMKAYHAAELAFFSRDYAALLDARRQLAAVPMPDGYEKGIERFRQQYPDAPPPVWPINLDVVDGLIACFNRPYSEAYSFACRPDSQAPALADDGRPCVDDRAALMAMDYWTFDQAPEGVRQVLDRPGCRIAGADLIRDYHAALRAKGAPVVHTFPEGDHTVTEDGEIKLLYWHEGQARAMAGQTDAAIDLFALSVEPPEKSFGGWNEYARASMAFLQGDLDALKAQREALAGKVSPGYTDINLGVVDGLIACFGRSYADAYGAADCNRRPGAAAE